jgi:hypothetical protein
MRTTRALEQAAEGLQDMARLVPPRARSGFMQMQEDVLSLIRGMRDDAE